MSLRHHVTAALALVRKEIGELIKLLRDQDTGIKSWVLLRAPWTPPGPLDEAEGALESPAAPRTKVDSWVKGLLNRTFGSYILAQCILLLGIPSDFPSFLAVYHSEMVVLRESQHNLRADAVTARPLPQLKDDLKNEIAEHKSQLKWSSPHSGAKMDKIKRLEEELAKYTSLPTAPSAYLPRGTVARISLRLLGGPAAHHASHIICHYPECQEILHLAVCGHCSCCICRQHRVLVGAATYKEGKAQGGMNCQCLDGMKCMENQGRVRQWLEVPDDLPVFQPKGGQRKGEGKRKDMACKSKAKKARW